MSRCAAYPYLAASSHARVSILAAAAFTLFLPACMQLPKEVPSARIESYELSDHVHYLASPQLKGRSARSLGSWNARRYLMDRYRNMGLVPFGNAKGYEQPFIIGTNVIGVLPGADPELADEFVILSAHYDHLGEHEGEMHLGAADNAAGVAVMLEVAERLARSPNRPSRSVVFAAFDAEEMGLMGSFAFTTRGDFKPEKLAGVVNLDMLGRDFLDVVEDTLLAFGTEAFPQLRDTVVRAGERAGVEVLPLGRDLVGPRSDHAPFELYGAPWVFLTCGQYSDYHKPTDTADKLDYASMARVARMVVETVRSLSNAEKIEAKAAPTAGDRGELRAVKTILEHVVANPDKTDVSEEGIQKLAMLAGQVDELMAAEHYSVNQRHAFASDLAETILPILMGGGAGEQQIDTMMVLRDLYLYTPRIALKGRRDLMVHILKHRPGIFRGTPPFHYAAADISDRTIQLDAQPDGRLRLSLLVPRVEAEVTIGWFGKHEQSIGFDVPVTGDFTGTPAQLVDYCLLRWLNTRGVATANEAWGYALRRITGEDFGDDLETWFAWRLDQTPYDTELPWLLDLMDSYRSTLRDQAVSVALWRAREQAMPRILEMVRDRDLSPAQRIKVIAALRKSDGPAALEALATALEDDRSVQLTKSRVVFDPDYPFYNHGISRVARKRLNRRAEQPPSVADAAREQLEKLTGESFGADAEAWRNWLAQARGEAEATDGDRQGMLKG